jgi:hypothetical protein
MTSAYTFLGYDFTFVACECCGREELKKTVKLSGPSGVVRYGTGCAARALGLTGTEVTRRATSAQKAADEAAAAERAAAGRASQARWEAHLIARTGGLYRYDRSPDVFGMIAALGGMKAAREGFAG